MLDATVSATERHRSKKFAYPMTTFSLLAAGYMLIGGPMHAHGDLENPPVKQQTYTVAQGDTIWDIAHRFNISVSELRSANHLLRSKITVGAKLVIPGKPAAASGDAPNVARPAPFPAPNTSRPALAPELPAALALPRREKRLTLTFSNLEVRTVLDQISNYAHVDVLMTPGAKGTISINIRDRSPDEAIRLVTAAAGLTAAKVGNAFVVGPPDEVAHAAAEFGKSDLITLRYLSPTDAVAQLGKLLPHLSVQPTRNGIIVSGLSEDIDLARELLPRIDVEGPAAPATPSESRVITLQHAKPEAAEHVLQEAYPTIRVATLDRTIIIIGLPAELDAATKAIASFDVDAPTVPEAQEVLIYRLKYLNAQRSEEAIKKAFPKVTASVAPEANAPPAAVFSPMTSIFGTGSGDFSNSGGGASSSSGGGGASSGTSSSGGGSGSSTGGSGSITPILSRPTRLIIVGPKSELAAVKQMLIETDQPQPSVRIEAVMMEINRTDSQDLGIAWDFTNTNLTLTEPAASNLTFGTLQHSSGSFNVALHALITQNRAKILASPNISVIDNEDASIFIGDMLRFYGSTTSAPNVGTIQSVEALPVGIALLMRPRIHPDGSVTLKVHPVISTVTGTVSNLPQTSSREADTTIRLNQGEQLVIGGLDRSDVTTTVNKVPLLGDLPFVKEFFRSRSHSTTKTEILIVIRAYTTTTEPAPAHDFKGGLK